MLAWALVAVPATVLFGAGAAVDVPPPSPAEIDGLVKRVGGATGEDRLAAARALAALPPSGAPEYAKRLARPRVIAADTIRTLLLEIWAQVPNPKPDGPLYVTKPEPKWTPPKAVKGKPRPKRPPPHDPEKVDWLEALSLLDVDANPALAPIAARVAARAEALEAVALMRALSASGRPESFDPLFDFAFALDGVFRDECGRAIRTLGGSAVPGLIRRQHAQGRGLAKQRRYASYQLDRMDRARPQKAIATAPDDRLRADMIHAYGEARALDAVEAVLGQVDAPSRRVRREARWAWLRYVAGPPPPPAPKRKRKLPGGGTESEEKEDYLNYREMAEIVLPQHVDDVLDKDPAAADGALARARRAGAPVDKLTEALFAYYDARRDAEWAAMYAAAVEKRRRGDLAGAVDDFSTILAHDPTYERRGEMAEAFQARGEAELGADPERGVRHLREAMALDPTRARKDEARIAFLEAQRARAAGSADPSPFRRVLAIDPDHADAKAVLADLEARAHRRRHAEIVTAGGGSLGLLIVMLLVARLLAGRRKA